MYAKRTITIKFDKEEKDVFATTAKTLDDSIRDEEDCYLLGEWLMDIAPNNSIIRTLCDDTPTGIDDLIELFEILANRT